MKYEECKVGQKVWIRSVKDLRNEFDDGRFLDDDDFMYAKFNYNNTMFTRYANGFLGKIIKVYSLGGTDVPIRVKTEYGGYGDTWNYKPEGLYLKEDV